MEFTNSKISSLGSATRIQRLSQAEVIVKGNAVIYLNHVTMPNISQVVDNYYKGDDDDDDDDGDDDGFLDCRMSEAKVASNLLLLLIK